MLQYHSNKFWTTSTPFRRTLEAGKCLRDERYQVAFRLSVNIQNVKFLAPPMLYNIETRRQCQPLAYRPVQASNRAPRSMEHERRNVVLGGTSRRTTKVHQQLYGDANTTRRTTF